MKKHELKAIIRECLIEILAEGLGDGMHGRAVIPQVQESSRSIPRKKSPLDERVTVAPRDISKAIQQTTKIISSDPLMQQIFADTAQTTMQKQNAAGHARAGALDGSLTAESIAILNSVSPQADAAAAAVANHDISDLFEGSDRWASLAFMDKSPGV